MPLPLKRAKMMREQLGFALNREGRFADAEKVLSEVIAEFGPSSETNGLLGRIYKDRWDLAKKEGLPEARALLTRAWSFQRGSGLGEYTTQAIVAAARALSFAREGDAERAREEAARATRTLTLSRYAASWLTAQTKLVLAGVAVHLGDLAAARVLLAEARPAATRDPGAVWLHAAVAEIAAQVDEAAVADPNAALTTAELRMLQYLPTHLTQAEIGERLHLSRNTVKSHTIAIYRKLGVNSRSEAVARGRELGLLEAR